MTSRIEDAFHSRHERKRHCEPAAFSPLTTPFHGTWYGGGATPQEYPALADAITQLRDAKTALEKAATVPAKIVAIESRLLSLESRRPVALVTIMKSLAIADIDVVKSIPVTIEEDGEEGFIASFMDAGISSGGETIPEAFESLQSMVATSFRSLMKMSDSNLGPKMLRQKLVLLEFLCPRSQRPTPATSQQS